VRNSPLVEGFRAENVTGLKLAAEAVNVQVQRLKSCSQWWIYRESNDRETPTSVGAERPKGSRRWIRREKGQILWIMPGYG